MYVGSIRTGTLLAPATVMMEQLHHFPAQHLSADDEEDGHAGVPVEQQTDDRELSNPSVLVGVVGIG